jgi:3-deoxy-alpha-D-manno-octulosonate 8-oxidase
MDTAKAVSILLTNPGKAADYQGWDLVKNLAIHKIGVPTLSGTGSESSSTCVLTNHAKGLKLGMNSPYSQFDQVVLDPDLTATVPYDQYTHTAMDTFFHCEEYLSGQERSSLQDALATKAVALIDDAVYDMPDGFASEEAREAVMVASFLGGSVAGCTGLIHPFSAGLSIMLGLRHGLANCVACVGLAEFYRHTMLFWSFERYVANIGIDLPMGLCADLDDDQMDALYRATVVHERPLANALGEGWRDVLTREKVYEMFRRM